MDKYLRHLHRVLAFMHSWTSSCLKDSAFIFNAFAISLSYKDNLNVMKMSLKNIATTSEWHLVFVEDNLMVVKSNNPKGFN